jgi:hypothetical protein
MLLASSQSSHSASAPRRAKRSLLAALVGPGLACLLAPAAFAQARPVAAFHREPGDSVVLQAGQPATFTSDSTPGSTLRWEIDGVAFGSRRSVTHSFADPGFHVVVLEATLNGETDTAVSVFGVNSPQYPLSPPRLMRPFPTVRLVGTVVPRGARIALLEVRGAPRVARVTVRCTGRGCPFGTRRRAATTGRVRFSKWPKVLLARARIEVFVRAPGVIGKYTAFRIRAGKRPVRTDRCLRPGVSEPTRCT